MKTTRRQFLATAALAAAAGSLSVSGAERPKRALRKAIMWGTVGVKGSVLEKMKLVRAAGFAGVEPNGGMDRAEVIAALKETGLVAASVCCHTHWVKPLSAPDAATRKIGSEGLIHSLQDAHAYGATSVLLVPGVVNTQVNYENCFARCVAEIKKAVPVAKDQGVKIAIENVWNNFVTKPKQAMDLLDAIGSEWVGWHFDIGNVGRYSPAEEWIPVLGKHILKLHIKEFDTRKMTDANPGAGFNAKFLEGTNNWPAIMKALDAIGYQGWGISEQGGGGTAEGLKDLSDRMTRIFTS